MKLVIDFNLISLVPVKSAVKPDDISTSARSVKQETLSNRCLILTLQFCLHSKREIGIIKMEAIVLNLLGDSGLLIQMQIQVRRRLTSNIVIKGNFWKLDCFISLSRNKNYTQVNLRRRKVCIFIYLLIKINTK